MENNISDSIWTLALTMSDLSLDRQEIWTNELLLLLLFCLILSWAYLYSSCPCCLEDFPKQIAKIMLCCWTWTIFPSQLSDGKGHGVRALQLKHAIPGSLIQTLWEREYENQYRSASRYNSTHLYIIHLLGPTLPHNSFSKIGRTSDLFPGLWNGYRKNYLTCLPNYR